MKPVRVVFWAAYLATSWTWCIGMVLPVLLMRDLGWLGFWVFAVPNCLGAAAMGWVIKSRSDSRRFTKRHPWPIATFSLVTILFHGAAIPWALSALGTQSFFPALAAAAITAWLAALLPLKRVPGLTFLVWLISLASLVYTATVGFTPTVSTIPAKPDPLNALLLAPVSLFGFALCPYLDATFQRTAVTLNWTDRAGAFTLGFCGLFLIMILFTAVYAAPLGAAFADDAFQLNGALATVLPIHLGMQAGLTVALHAREGKPKSLARPKWSALTLAALALGTIAWLTASNIDHMLAGLTPEEVIYRLILGAYGLFFPAYIYRIARHKDQQTTRLLNYALPVLLAAPLLTAGFLLRESIWLIPGLLIPLLTPTLTRPKSATT